MATKCGRKAIERFAERMGETRHRNKILVGKHHGQRPLAMPRGRLQNNIKMYLRAK
jgi:hypothetical protein